MKQSAPKKYNHVENEAVSGSSLEPIAIVGMACRLPGGIKTPDEYWDFLCQGRSGIGEIPAARWNVDFFCTESEHELGRSTTKWGGFIDDPDMFDAEFFGISPREAAAMDPQQRLMLMCSWEALEDAGIPQSEIRNTQAGVFVGVSMNDYSAIQRSQVVGSEVHAATGNALSIVANRISHRFDLNGPSLSIDTACSSSLVAGHMATRSLQTGETSLCILGGVNLLFDPTVFIQFSNANMMSPTGQCKTFDENANGYVRAEGAGVIILKRLSDAVRDNDRIHAVIRSTGVNQDGGTSTITVPSTEAQASMLRQALKSGGVAPHEVDFVEAHGTGTPIGDPIEATAIGSVFGQCARDDEGVYVGAGKSQIGHMESASGIAGLIKAALAVKHGKIPANLNFSVPNPNIDFNDLGIRLPLELLDWPSHDRPRIAAINSFGFGGTNGCAIIQEPPTTRNASTQGQPAPAPDRWVVPLSAASEPALRERAGQLASFIELDGKKTPQITPLADLVGTLSRRREHLPERAAIIGKTRKQLVKNLREMADGAQPPDIDKPPTFATGRATNNPKLMFLFTGQGSQYWNMGRQLLERDTVFRDAIGAFDEVFADISGWSIISELTKSKRLSRIHETRITQPAILAVQLGLFARWQAWGYAPEGVLGHSLGEAPAAYAAGAISIEDLACLVHHRGRLSEKVEGNGSLAVVGLSAPAAQDILDELGEERVVICAINGSNLVNLGGEARALDGVLAHLETKDIFIRRLAMNYAPHTFMMDEVEDELRAATAHIQPCDTDISIISSVTGMQIDGSEFTADHWWRNIRQPVLFKDSVDEAVAQGYNMFLELGPHGALSGLVSTCLAESGTKAPVISSQHRDAKSQDALYAALGKTFVAGIEPNWSRVNPSQYSPTDLPHYPWQLTRYWEISEETRENLFAEVDYPLLGVRQAGASPTWRSEISTDRHPFLADHVVQNAPVLPAAAHIDIMLSVGRILFGEGMVELQDISFLAAMQLSAEEIEEIETGYDASTRRVEIFSRRKDSGDDWVLRASCKLSVREQTAPTLRHWHKDEKFKSARTRVTAKKYYSFFDQTGIEYGPAFRGLKTIWAADKVAAGSFRLPEEATSNLPPHLFNPAAIDCGFQVTLATGISEPSSTIFLPVKVGRIRFFRTPGKQLFFKATEVDRQTDTLTYDVEYYDHQGRTVCIVEGLVASDTRLRNRAGGDVFSDCYVERWQQQDLEPSDEDAKDQKPAAPRHWLLLGDSSPLSHELADHFLSRGDKLTLVEKAAAYEQTENIYRIDPGNREHFTTLFDSAYSGAGAPTDIISLWSMTNNAGNTVPKATDLLAWQDDNAVPLIWLAQAFSEQENLASGLWLVTAGAQFIPDVDRNKKSNGWRLAQSPSNGLMRSIATELPQLKTRTIDLDISKSPAARANLILELYAASPEQEITLRDTRRYVGRLELAPQDELPPFTLSRHSLRGDETFRVTMPGPGIIDTLTLVDTDRTAPGRGEVEIAVKAVGLNFRDVMAAAGLLPGEAEKGHAWDSLGLECTGLVTRLGKGVKGLKIGDRIMTMGKGCFRGHLVVPEIQTFKIPKSVSLQHAATISSAYATAYFSMLTLGRMQKGDRVLIHTATGGVGFAAVQIAKMVGAEIFATAGSNKKRAFLKKLGIKHVMNSRTLEWDDEIMAKTKGEGVDLVLNALAGPAIEMGLSVLRPFGRFLEIGKRDIYADNAIGMKSLARNITFHVIDMANIDARRAPEVAEINRTLLRLIAQKKLLPPPIELFPVSKIADAFTMMQRANHIGKVVVSLDDKDIEISRDDKRPIRLPHNSAYLITGGLGGLGLRIAEWLAERRAGQLYLMGRSGAASAESKAALQRIRSAGCRVTVLKADVADSNSVAEALVKIKSGKSPLRGVIHSAGILNDVMLDQMTLERFQNVLAPKIAGAWNLHLETLDCPLDFFVSFSSIASLLPSTGQGNYIAANCFLDRFSAWRRTQGLPAQTINWGVLAETGMAQRKKGLTAYVESKGIFTNSIDEVLNALEMLLRKDIDAAGYFKIDWHKLASTSPALKASLRTKDLADQLAKGPAGGGKIKSALLAANETERTAMLREYLTELVAKTLKTEAAGISSDRSLAEIGLDSLTSFELKNRIESELTVELPVAKFLQKPTIDGLSAAVLDNFSADQGDQEIEKIVYNDLPPLGKTAQEFWTTWFEHRKPAPNNRVFDVIQALSVEPSLDTKTFRRAFNQLTNRHAILRTAFIPQESATPRIAVREIHPTGLEVHELKALSERKFEDYFKARTAEPIDPTTGNVFRIALFKRPTRDVIFIQVAEIIADGWSNILLMRELLAIYFGFDLADFGAGANSSLTNADFINWEEKYLAGPESKRGLEIMTAKIKRNSERLNIFEDRPRKNGLIFEGGRQPFALSGKETNQIRKIARKRAVSVYSLLFAGSALMVHYLTNRNRFVITNNAANRTRKEFEEIIGCQVNLLPNEVNFSGVRNFNTLVTKCHREITDNLALQSISYSHAISEIGKANPKFNWTRDEIKTKTSLYQFAFCMRHPGAMGNDEFTEFLSDGSGNNSADFFGSTVRRIPLAGNDAFYDLGFFVQEGKNGVYGDCIYNADIYDPGTVENMVTLYCELMRNVISKPEAALAEIFSEVTIGRDLQLLRVDQHLADAAE